MGYRLTCSQSPWVADRSDQHFPLSVSPLSLSLCLPCLAKLKPWPAGRPGKFEEAEAGSVLLQPGQAPSPTGLLSSRAKTLSVTLAPRK